MKVVRTITTFYPHVTGPANQAFEISRRLVERDHDSTVLTTTRKVDGVEPTETMDGVRVRRFRALGEDVPYTFTPGVVRGIARSDPDLIHAHSFRNFLTDAGYLLSKLESVPFVLHGHGTFFGYRHILEDSSTVRYRAYDRFTGKRAAVNADAVVVSTEQEKDEAVEFGVDAAKVHVVPVGQDVERYDAVQGDSPEDRFRVLLVGRLEPSRNVEQAIEAISRLPEDVELRIVGGEEKRSNVNQGGYLDRLEESIERLRASDRVTFAGPQYDDDLVREYRSADAFVYPSRYENFGQTVLEAAAAGLPVVATPEGVARDLVSDGETGYLVDVDDVEATVDGLQRIRELGADEFAERIQRRVRETYSWDTITEQYLQIYRQLV